MLVRVTFLYPEPSFAYTADDPNTTAAVDADELVSGFYSPERRPWLGVLELLSHTRLHVAAPVIPA